MNQDKCVVHATAPIRVCDLGGWTDTWFAESGAVLNMGVYPYTEAQIEVLATPQGAQGRIAIHAENYGDRYVLDGRQAAYGKHPLIEASLDIMELPPNLSFNINLFSQVPAGCSTGTSASVSVALLAGLDLLTPGRLTPHEIASLSHRVETEKLELQCGIQDQLAAAYGGICFIEMSRYPQASVSQLHLPNNVWWELERRLALVFLGQSHVSSEVHGTVIERLEQPHADKSDLELLRRAAHLGKNALLEGDFPGFGHAMIENTEGQRNLHPSLVSPAADEVIGLARKHNCIGWKVNGAGGDGGSLSLLFGGNNEDKRNFVGDLKQLSAAYRVIPIYLSRMGIRRWITQA